MKVLLDECIDWRLARDIAGHDVKTTRQMGWVSLKNGELLKFAIEQFDVFVTVDRNHRFNKTSSPTISWLSYCTLEPTALPIFNHLSQNSLTALPTVKPGITMHIGR